MKKKKRILQRGELQRSKVKKRRGKRKGELKRRGEGKGELR